MVVLVLLLLFRHKRLPKYVDFKSRSLSAAKRFRDDQGFRSSEAGRRPPDNTSPGVRSENLGRGIFPQMFHNIFPEQVVPISYYDEYEFAP